MAGTQVQLRRGTTTEHATFTGAEGEVTVDTTKDVPVVHDGVTAGGFPAAALHLTQSYSKAQRGTVSALGNQSGTITLDMATANNFSMTLNANSSNTLANPSNLTAGQSGVIVVTQDSTGSRTLAYGTYWKFQGGAAPTLTTTASAVDVIAYYVESTTRITARFIGDVK